MSRGGRGGRGGRGRGGRGPGADLMRDTFEDIGMSAFSEIPGRGPPVLYPPIELNAPVTIAEYDTLLIEKMREVSHRIENSPYFITLKTEETDIVRYSDKYRNNGKELGLMECINSGVDDSTQYIPSELLNGSVTGGRSAMYTGEVDQMTNLKRKRDVDLQKLEQQETAGGDGKGKDKKEDSDAEGDDDMNDNDEFEMDDDYGVDHYASGDDGGYDSGGDGEAFF